MTDVVKEFLVSLAYRVDEQSERKFLDKIAVGTKRIAELTVAFEGMALAWRNTVERTSAALEKLYYSSQRTGSSVGDIQAFKFAASQLGSSGDEAEASIEAFARKLRETPGAEAFLKSHGVITRVNGEMRGATDMARDFVERTRRFPYFVALQYHEFMGLSEKTVLALRDPEFKRQQERWQQKRNRAGLNPDDAARGARGLMVAWRDFTSSLEIILEKVVGKIAALLGTDIEHIGDWLDSHADEISDKIIEIGEAIFKLAGHILQLVLNSEKWWPQLVAFMEGIQKFGTWVNEAVIHTIGWDNAAKLLIALFIGSWLTKLVGVFGAVTAAWLAMIGAFGFKIPDYKAPLGAGLTHDPTGEREGVGRGGAGGAGGIGARIRHAMSGRGGRGPGGGDPVGPALTGKGIYSGRTGSWWTPERMKHMADRLVKEAGLSPHGAAGLVARMAGVEAAAGPGAINPYSGAAGIAQWLGSRKFGFQMGDFDSQISKVVSELNGEENRAARALRAAKTPEEGARGASMFERAEHYNAATGNDAWTLRTPAGKVYDTVKGLGGPGGTAPSKPTVPQGVVELGTLSQNGKPLVTGTPSRPLGDRGEWEKPISSVTNQRVEVNVPDVNDPEHAAQIVTRAVKRAHGDMVDTSKNKTGRGAGSDYGDKTVNGRKVFEMGGTKVDMTDIYKQIDSNAARGK